MKTILLLAVILLLSPARTRADDLHNALILFENLEYGKAQELVERLLLRPIEQPEDMVTAYRIHGLCLSALGKPEAAMREFQKLLSIDPLFRLSDDVSPKLAGPFFQALAMTRNAPGINLTHHPPASPAALGGLVLQATLESDPMKLVAAIRLRFRGDGEQKILQIVDRIGNSPQVAMKVPAGLTDRRLSYYFEATNQYGGVLARVGSPGEPLQLQVAVTARVEVDHAPVAPPVAVLDTRQEEVPAAKGSAPWYRSWWLWTAAWFVVAGGASVLVLTLNPDGVHRPADYGIMIK